MPEPNTATPLPLETLKAKYAKANQSHVFQFYDSLSEQERQALIHQLSPLDPEHIQKIFQGAQATSKIDVSKLDLQPLPPSIVKSLLTMSKDEEKKYETIGLKAIRENKVAIVLLAGGQGTRLGSAAPKGCYDIGLPSGKSLFQLQAERLKTLQHLAGGPSCQIPWYIMVSGPTRKDTEDFFKSKAYFGLAPKQVTFFEQGTLPAIDEQGRFMMESRSQLSLAPDGNGGIYRALHVSGVLQSMQQQKIEYVHAYCVDNCLVKVGDPVFVGYTIAHGYHVTAKTVVKETPDEPVGVVCVRDGKFSVVEYSELPKHVSEQRAPEGKLVYFAANIANHVYTVSFLQSVLAHQAAFPYHVAHKKITTVDTQGNVVTPTAPNGWKMELFIFDVFPFCTSFGVLEVDRQWEFAPLKNKTGTDSPVTSRQALMKLHAHYLRTVGAILPNQDSTDFVCEISPLISYAGEGLEKYKGKTLASPVIIQ